MQFIINNYVNIRSKDKLKAILFKYIPIYYKAL